MYFIDEDLLEKFRKYSLQLNIVCDARYGENERLKADAERSNTKSQLIATFRQMRKPYQLLLIPLTIFSGLEQSFFSADYTQV